MSTRLFEPLQIGNRQLRNRVTMAALTRLRAAEDGVPNALHAEYYSQRASAGLVVTEGTFSSFGNRAFPGQPGIVDDSQEEGWREVADAVHAAGGTIFMQIMHGGRASHPNLLRGQEPEAPSAISSETSIYTFDGKLPTPTPRALETEELPRIVEEFRAAARRAIDAGIDGVEVHGANGYLLHEFLAPNANRRTDDYGGTPENRARLAIEVVRAVAEEIGAENTALRISPQHPAHNTNENDPADMLATYGALLRGVADLPLAYVSVLKYDLEDSVGAGVRAFVQDVVQAPLLLNTGFTNITQLDEAKYLVDDLGADAAVVGRMLIANPDLVERWETGAELNEPDVSTFYTSGAHGYTDYPVLAHDRA